MKTILTIGYRSVCIDGLDAKAVDALTRAVAVDDTYTNSGKVWKHTSDAVTVEIVQDRDVIPPAPVEGQDLATVKALCDAAGVKITMANNLIRINDGKIFKPIPSVDRAAWEAWEAYTKEAN